MSLVSRYIEAAGIPTVVFSTARDIVETCGVPRHVFTDFPLGNPCGESFDASQQMAILELGLGLLENASEPGVLVQSPYAWSAGEKWKDLIFTPEQPFLEGEAYDNWMAAKQKYREKRATGEL